MKNKFDHEDLRVYSEAVQFVSWTKTVLERTPKSCAVYNQLDRASTSIVLNIAEGNGKFTAPDRCKFFDIARGSALECAACLDIVAVKELATGAEISVGKEMLLAIVSMLVGLIKSTSTERLYESPEEYDRKDD
jgi:four helix bundle protein